MPVADAMTSRSLLAPLKSLAAQALLAADGSRAVHQALLDEPITGPVRVLAIGKAAAAMMRGAVGAIGGPLRAALVISNDNPALTSLDGAIRVMVSGHPLPDARSLAAGAAAMRFVADTAPDETLLVLLSGGASALCEQPRNGITLAELQALQRDLLGLALAIADVNAIRQCLSLIKAGGLARCYPGRRAIRQLIVSDVPGDDPAVIGSAPFVGVEATLPDLARLPTRWQSWLQRQLAASAAEKKPELPPVASRIVASNGSVRAALSAFAATQGWPVQVNEAYAGELGDVLRRISAMLTNAPPGLLLFGGECHLALPAQPGRGGRNQHLALALQQLLTDPLAPLVDTDIAVLTLATDGVDGQSDAAGACFVHAGSSATTSTGQSPPPTIRHRTAIDTALKAACSYDYWRENGGLLVTGATGSNVADLVLIHKA